MSNENVHDEAPIEFDLLAQLELIEQNTERTKFATQAIGQLLIYPVIGYLLGGAISIFGWLMLTVGSTDGSPGVFLVIGGALVAIGFMIRGVLLAMKSLRESQR